MPPDEDKDIKVQTTDGSLMTLRLVEEFSPTFYINNASFGMTQWDIKIEVSEIQGYVPGENPESPVALVHKKARLVMTVPYARVFANALLAQVEKHESIEKGAPQEPVPNPAAEPPRVTRRIRMKSNSK